MEKFNLINVHISTIQIGDIVLVDGKAKTVGRNNLGRDDLLGRTLFGDSYCSGHKSVRKVINYSN